MGKLGLVDNKSDPKHAELGCNPSYLQTLKEVKMELRADGLLQEEWIKNIVTTIISV